jgi:hypothetical protein
MPPVIPQNEIEEQIREEFRTAFDEWERAPENEKEAAGERLDRAIRRLYDFVGCGKVPQD